MLESELLKLYKEYDEKNPIIKIFVSYIKPSFLFSTKILIPIHLGRDVAQENSKDGIINNEALDWLYDNCIGSKKCHIIKN